MNNPRKGGLFAVTLSLYASLAASAPAAPGQTPENFYRGKQISLIVGTDPGGGADLYGRFLARYIGEYIPGKPTVVVLNMVGAGGMRAANYLQNVGPQDGSELTIATTGLPLAQAFGDSSVKFDLSKFHWIGNMSQSPNVMITWSTTQVKTMNDARQKEIVVGSTSPLSTDSMASLVANSVLGTRFRVVNGYSSGGTINLAMEHGEIGGRAGITWAEVKSQKPYWIANHSINILAQMGTTRNAELSDIPLLTEFARNDDDRDVLAFISDISVVARAIAVGPRVPPDRVAVLRHAFDAAMRDPAVLAEGKREHLDISPTNADETSAVIDSLVEAKHSVIDRVKTLITK
jgi:tripartite-type tricarboxylate transporter receptor subunit TctC